MKAFHFGGDLIADVTRGGDSTTSGSNSLPSSATNRSSNSSRTLSSNETTELYRKKKEAIVSFLFRIGVDCGERIPHKTEVHLPFHRKKEIYPIFLNEFKVLYLIIEPPTPQYFRRMWRAHCPEYKIMRTQRFSICGQCDRLKTCLREAILQGRDTSTIKEQRKLHLDFVFRERMEYHIKKDRARLNGSEYLSIIVDGADQSAFGLPHFTTKNKSQRGHALKVKLIGIIDHQVEKQLTLMTMTEEHATGANHIVEVIHRILCARRSQGQLPPNFYIQLDNCSRENKNKYVLSLLEMLVSLGVFLSVEVGFLPVGHTHEDVDQAFSQTSARLPVNDAITLGDLHKELTQTNNGKVKVQDMRKLINWSGLCDEEK